jgi:hypothetical protein
MNRSAATISTNRDLILKQLQPSLGATSILAGNTRILFKIQKEMI